MKIGVMGDKGSFSEEAAQLYTQKKRIKKFSIKYLINADSVLRCLQNNKIDLGILPISNTTAGMVIESVQALEKYSFRIASSFKMPIKHFLLINPCVNKKDVSMIISHIQPLTQCKKYLQKKWKNTKKMEYTDTAKAAKDLANGKLPANSAVIAPRKCAEIYGLKILAKNIQDNKNNVTMFLVIKK